MPKFRSRPVEIEAVQVNWNNWNAVCDFMEDHGKSDHSINAGYLKADEVPDTCGENGPDYIVFEVTTAHGEKATVRHGDWLIPDAKPGTFYPCKPDIFKEKYFPLNFVGQELTWEQFNNPDRLRD